MTKKIIKKVFIDQSSMLDVGAKREITVFGEIGAEFNINIIKINGNLKESYYNFVTNTFTEAFVAANNLQVELFTESFSKLIVFPADASGEVYSIKTIAKEQTTQFSKNNFVDTKTITQVGQTIISFQAPDDFNSDSKLTALPSAVQSTGSTALSPTVTVPIEWTFTNTSSDTKGFGLRLPGLPVSNEFIIPNSYWYSQQVVVVDGNHVSVTEIAVDSIGNTVAGMELDGVLAAGGGKIFVTSISGTTITFSSVVSASNNDQLKLKAYGPNLIKSIFGQEVEFSNFVARGVPLEKQVRTETTFPLTTGNVTLNLNGTYGVGGGGHVRLEGFNVNNSANNNLITTVTASSTAGSVVINYAGASDDITKVNVIPVGTKLNVIGSHQVITVTGNVKIKKYPDVNAKVILDMTQIITAGTADE